MVIRNQKISPIRMIARITVPDVPGVVRNIRNSKNSSAKRSSMISHIKVACLKFSLNDLKNRFAR